MAKLVLMETRSLDEQALRQRLAALGAAPGWRLQRQERGWLLRLDESAASIGLCAALLRCTWLRRLECIPGGEGRAVAASH